jgi:hypothetical protein
VTWTDLFERAATHDVTDEEIREALARRRETRGDDGRTRTSEGNEGPMRERATDGADTGVSADPMARVVADADVLAADLLIGGPSRRALDIVFAHDWIRLIASEPLRSDAEAVIGELADPDLAAAWRTRIAELATPVEHPDGDHPALASALHGDARHVLSLDDRLLSAGAGAAIRREANVETSVRTPDAFARLFDPASVCESIYAEPYPGPDRDRRP